MMVFWLLSGPSSSLSTLQKVPNVVSWSEMKEEFTKNCFRSVLGKTPQKNLNVGFFSPSYKNSQNLRLVIFVPNKLIVKPVFTVLTIFEKPNFQKLKSVGFGGYPPPPLLEKVHTFWFLVFGNWVFQR